MQQREIRSLSPREIADLRAGRGMGLALAAELNGYPGPLHTLEPAEPLKLTPEKLAAATDAAARAQGRLRAARLRHHLEMMEVLTPGQVDAYKRLRGY